MQLGMIGLGRMGSNMVRRLMRAGHECVVFDVHPEAVRALGNEGAVGTSSLAAFVAALAAPRAIWLMVPGRGRGPRARGARAPARARATSSWTAATRTTTTISGGRRSSSSPGVHYLDVGTSGGVWGLERGYCLMIGGDAPSGASARPDLRALAPGAGAVAEHAGPTIGRGYRRARLSPLRPVGRRALREDGPQRHRVRHHGGLRRRAQHPAPCRCRQAHAGRPTPKRRRSGIRSTTGIARSRRYRRSVAPRQRDRLVAAGPDRPRARTTRRTSRRSRAGCRTRARGAGPCRPRWTKRCPCRC